MRVNILTCEQPCKELLTSLQGSNSLNIEVIPLTEYDSFSRFTENKFGWTSWLKMESLGYGGYDFTSDELSGTMLKSKVFPMDEFIRDNKSLNVETIKSLFFSITETGYETETFRDTVKHYEDLNIEENCFGFSLEFLYHENRGMLIAGNEYIGDSYKQLRDFQNSFANQFDLGSLYILPHINPEAYLEIEKIELQEMLDQVNKCDSEYVDGWDELGRQEERRMDEETDGDWRWNID